MTRNRWIAVGAAVVIVAIAAFALFRPDKLFTDQVVDEQLDDDVVAALDAQPPATDTDNDTGSDSSSEDESTDPTDAAPSTTAPAGPTVVSGGEWISLDHPTSGTVAIVEDGGASTLVFSELQSDNGPDLHVYLSPAPAEVGADYLAGSVKLGPLKGNVGTQTYELPAGTDPSAFNSVVIWCDRFASGFGAAPLAPA